MRSYFEINEKTVAKSMTATARKYGMGVGGQATLIISMKTQFIRLVYSQQKTTNISMAFLPPADVVRREGYVLTRLCPSVCP